jgi:hypothetical protein
MFLVCILHVHCFIYPPLVPCVSQVVTAAIAVLWCIAAAEEHHDLLTETALSTVLSTMTDHVENARVQENCSGFLFSLSSTVRCGTRTAPSHLRDFRGVCPISSALLGLALGFLRRLAIPP